MQSRSLKAISPELNEGNYHFVNLRITYKRASVPLLEASTFRDPSEAMEDICSLEHVNECVILSTCNRVEVFAVVQSPEVVEGIVEYWRSKTGPFEEAFDKSLERAFASEALLHLLRLSSGLESMMVGEDQILGQVQEAYTTAKTCGAAGPISDKVFWMAIKTGKDVRHTTGINRGAVSLGSAAVIFLEKLLGDLDDREIAIIGAGETATLVGKALTSKDPQVFVANRTLERGIKLAKKLGGEVVRFEEIESLLTQVDAAFVATSAPKPILTRELFERVMAKRGSRGLIIIDLSQPRNVEEGVAELSHIELFNIDHLREIADRNLRARLDAAKKAEVMVQNELRQLESLLRRERVEPVISAIWRNADEIRCRELEKALRMLDGLDEEQRKTVEKLSKVLVKRILHNPITMLRQAAVREDITAINVAQTLFNVRSIQGEKIE